MYISRFELHNYKSFYEPTPIALQPGFNIITGQNNAGKSALLTALSLRFVGNPHLSEKTVPAPGSAVNTTSWCDVSLSATPLEVLRVLQRPTDQNWWIARPQMQGAIAHSLGWTNGGLQDIQTLIHHVFSRDALTFRVRYQAGQNQNCSLTPIEVPTFGLYTADGQQNNRPFTAFQVRPDLTYQASGGGVVSSESAEFGMTIFSHFQSRVYRFSAERFNIGACAHGNNPVLRPDAGNLPEVLEILQANTHRFGQFNDLLAKILPQVHHVSVRPSPQRSQDVEIIVWNTKKETQRIDLTQPLSECGTGIGQVMAILYVMLHPETAETLIIDEPQSFLHPGAARKLIEVLKTHSKQQIIVATHSPTIISAAEPETITIAAQRSSETQLQQLEARDSKTLEVCLAEIGARLTDVFGADDILWVEGATEAICFPLILTGVAKRTLMGTAIVGVRQVGDLEGRDARRVFEIYNSLSTAGSLMPPAVGFLLDRECRTPQQKEELNKMGKGLVTFLPRRMYENYLLQASAIVRVVNSIEGFSAELVTEAAVQTLIDAKRSLASHFCGQQIPSIDSDWIREIDGARVLHEVFSELSESRVSYDKVKHSVELTKCILDQSPAELKGIAALLTQILR